MECAKKTKKVHKMIKTPLRIGRSEYKGGAETLLLYLDVSVVIY